MTRTQKRAALLAACAATALLAQTDYAQAQAFKAAGPSTLVGPGYFANGADLPATDQDPTQPPKFGTASGAVQALAINPFNKDIWLAGSTNGGIFRSTDGGKTWTATTDNLSSLAIGSISFDLTDPTGNRVVASRRRTSSGFYSYDLTGELIYSNDGGTTWATKSGEWSGYGLVINRGNTVIAGGNTVIAGSVSAVGIRRSIDGGLSYYQIALDTSQLPGGTPLAGGTPLEDITSLVGDPQNPNRIYAAMKLGYNYSGSDPNAEKTSLFVSEDSGASWTKIFSKADAAGLINDKSNTSLRVAAGPNGSLAVMIISGGQTIGVFASLRKPNCLDTDPRNWINLSSALSNSADSGTGIGSEIAGEDEENEEADGPKSVNPGYQAYIHSAIAIDPTDPTVIYIAGDRLDPPGLSGYSANMIRFKINSDDTFSFEPLTDDFTSDKSTIHPDTRVLTFDKDNNLISGNDGGLYFRTNPKTTSGVWRGLNSGRQALEIYRLSLDGNTGRLGVAAQDNGTAVQSLTDPKIYNLVNGGDGGLAFFNSKSVAGNSYFYSSSQFLGSFNRARYKIGVNGPDQYTYINFYNVADNKDIDLTSQFIPVIKFNNIDQSYIFVSEIYKNKPIVFQDIFEDSSKYTDPNCTSYCNIKLAAKFIDTSNANPLTFNRGGYAGSVDFGTADNKFALLALAKEEFPQAGDSDNPRFLWLSTGTTLDTISLQPVTSYTWKNYGGATLFDPRNQGRFFVTSAYYHLYGPPSDSTYYAPGLWGSVDGGLTGTDYSPSLPTNIRELMTMAFINSNGVNALLIGGRNTTDNAGNPIVVADSSSTGVLSGWRRFGTGLPNALVTQLDFNPGRNTLAVGTFGRGAFLLFDVTTYFASASSLQFGLANNDSVPSDTYLTGNRPLEKYGSGTLVLTGNPTYTGDTFVKEGLVINNAYSKSHWQIDSAGVVSGIGQIDAGVTLNGGRLEPGYDGQGVLTIGALSASDAGGQVKLQANSLYRTALNILGNANLTGIAVNLVKDGDVGIGTGATSFKVSSALVLTAQSVTGQFTIDPAASPLNFAQAKPGDLATRLRYDIVSNGVVLEQVQTLDWTKQAKTPNQLALAKALNPSQLAGSDAWRGALTAISGDNTIDRLKALTSLSGIGTVNSALSNQTAVNAVMSTLADRMIAPNQAAGLDPAPSKLARLAPQLTNAKGVFDLARTAQALSADSNNTDKAPGQAWSSAFNLSERLSDAEGQLRTTGAGLVGGYDQTLGQDTTIGYAAAYMELKSKTLSDRSENQSQYWSVAAYASHKFGPVLTGLSASYSGGEISTRRTLVLPGATTDARGDTQSRDLSAMVFAAAQRDLGAGWRIVGKAAATYSDMKQDAMTEQGAGPFALEVGATDYQQLVGQLGAQVWRQIKLNTGTLRLYAEAQAYGRSLDDGPAAKVRFANHQTEAFDIQGAQTPSSWSLIGLGAHYAPSERLALNIAYRATTGGKLKQDMVSVGAALSW